MKIIKTRSNGSNSIKFQKYHDVLISFFSMLCFREFYIGDEISKNIWRGNKNKNRKSFLGASHCIYLKFFFSFFKCTSLLEYIKMPVLCNSLVTASLDLKNEIKNKKKGKIH